MTVELIWGGDVKMRLTKPKLEILEWIYECQKNGEIAWKYRFPCYNAYINYYARHVRMLVAAGFVEEKKLVNKKTGRSKLALFLTDKALSVLQK